MQLRFKSASVRNKITKTKLNCEYFNNNDQNEKLT